MDKAQLVRELSQLLPIDDDSLGQMIENAWNLPSHSAIFEYWTGLLGQSPDALDFITHFTSNDTSQNQGTSSTKEKKPISTRNSSSSATSSNKQKSAKPPWNLNSSSVQPQQTTGNKSRLKKNVSTTLSQLLEKPKEQETPVQKKDKQKRLQNLKDLEEVLKQLELQNNDEKYSVCNCMARIHPLFEVAPNCLNCGKIICVKEGLRPCSFCGSDLIDSEEKARVIQLLELEKAELDGSKKLDSGVASNHKAKSKPKVQKIQYNAGAGNDFWKKTDKIFESIDKSTQNELKKKEQLERESKELKEQDKAVKYYEYNKGMDSDLLKAKANLENLLSFQANSSERTKIIDQVSDFEIPTGSNLNIWSSTVEKALQLKKQQQVLRSQEEKEKERSGRGKRVLDITIGKDGKAVLTEVSVREEPDKEELKKIAELENDIQRQRDIKNNQEFATVWDYKKDSEKWEKPKYVGSVERTEDSEIPKGLTEAHRVQLGSFDDVEEMVTVI